MNPIAETLDSLVELLRNDGLQEWGPLSYTLLLALVIIEGRIVTLLAVLAASAGYMRLPLVMGCAIAGGLIADSLWYLLGYAHAQGRVLRYGRWLGIDRRHLELLQADTQRHGLKLLLAAKLTSVFVIPTLIAAGVARVPFRRWFPVVLLGEILWVSGLAFIGFQAREVAERVEIGLHYLPAAGGVALLTLLIVAARRLGWMRRQTRAAPAGLLPAPSDRGSETRAQRPFSGIATRMRAAVPARPSRETGSPLPAAREPLLRRAAPSPVPVSGKTDRL